MLNEKLKKIAFLYFDKTVGKLYPLDSDKHDGWVGYTTNFCEANDTFLFGYPLDEKWRVIKLIYFWGKGFDFEGFMEAFDLEYDDARKYLEAYIQQFYDEPIDIC
jgi:hypothetical protein